MVEIVEQDKTWLRSGERKRGFLFSFWRSCSLVPNARIRLLNSTHSIFRSRKTPARQKTAIEHSLKVRSDTELIRLANTWSDGELHRTRTRSFGFAYYIVTKASYNDGTGAGAETWKGTALHVDGGYNLPVGETFFICIRMNYSMATYTEKIIGSTTYSTISYRKTTFIQASQRSISFRPPV